MTAPVQGWTMFWEGGRMSSYASGTRRPGEPAIVGGHVALIGGTIEACRYGLHGSERLLDALGFSPCDRPTIGRCEFGGEIGREDDKLAARSRTVLWLLDADQSERVLRVHARWSALTVLHLWDAPAVVVRYLVTGDEALRDAAWAAAMAAAWAAASDAAWAAAMAAAWAAASDAAMAAAWAAAWAAASDAAMAAAWAAAWAASNAELERLAWCAHRGEPVGLTVPESARAIAELVMGALAGQEVGDA